MLAEHWKTSARVLATDIEKYLVVLRLKDPAPATLTAAQPSEAVPDALVAWDWLDDRNPTGRAFRPTPFSQLRVQSLPSDVCERIAFLGHVRKGMSGGPLTSPVDGTVHGVVVNARPDVDEHEIIASWWSYVRDDWVGTPEDEAVLLAGLRAQLALGFGLATPIKWAVRLLGESLR